MVYNILVCLAYLCFLLDAFNSHPPWARYYLLEEKSFHQLNIMCTRFHREAGDHNNLKGGSTYKIQCYLLRNEVLSHFPPKTPYSNWQVQNIESKTGGKDASTPSIFHSMPCVIVTSMN